MGELDFLSYYIMMMDREKVVDGCGVVVDGWMDEWIDRWMRSCRRMIMKMINDMIAFTIMAVEGVVVVVAVGDVLVVVVVVVVRDEINL